MAIDWNAIKRIGAGSGIGSLAMLLANRYLLGNKSTKSNVLAGLIGAAGGGLLGHRYHLSQAGKDQNSADQETITEDMIPENQRAQFRHYNQEAAWRVELANKLEALDNTEMPEQQRAEMKAELLRKVAVPHSALTMFDSDKFNVAQQYLKFYGNDKAIAASIKTEKGADRGALHRPSVVADYEYLRKNHKFDMTIEQYEAVRLYHKLLKDVYSKASSDYQTGGSRSYDAKKVVDDPTLVDYIAYNSMPVDYQKHLPIAHRAMSASRAGMSKGAAYFTDSLMFNRPDDADSKLNWYQGIRTMDSTAKVLADVAAYGVTASAVGAAGGLPWLAAHPYVHTGLGLTIPIAGSVGTGALVDKLLPHTDALKDLEKFKDYEMADRASTGWWDRSRYNRAYNDAMALMFSPAHTPQYYALRTSTDPKALDTARTLGEDIVLSSVYLNPLGATKAGIRNLKEVPRAFARINRLGRGKGFLGQTKATLHGIRAATKPALAGLGETAFGLTTMGGAPARAYLAGKEAEQREQRINSGRLFNPFNYMTAE